MTNTNRHEVLIGQADNCFVAVSVNAPYFCFEAETEEAAAEKAKRALAFFHQHQATPSSSHVAKARKLSTFFPLRSISMSELVAA